MKRFGQIIGVKPEHFERYKKYHAAVWPAYVRAPPRKMWSAMP